MGVEGPPASVGFSVDTTAPRALTLRRFTPKPGLAQHALLLLGGARAGRHGHVAHPEDRRRGRAGTGQRRGGRRGAEPPARRSTPSRRAQTDLAVNASPPGSDAFVVLPRLAPGIRLPMRNVGRLRPLVGATVRAVRPTLRWAHGPKGTRIYNVQLFRVVDGAKLRKVVSVFPHRQRYVVSRKKALARGACYVWRAAVPRSEARRRPRRREPLLRAPALAALDLEDQDQHEWGGPAVWGLAEPLEAASRRQGERAIPIQTPDPCSSVAGGRRDAGRGPERPCRSLDARRLRQHRHADHGDVGHVLLGRGQRPTPGTRSSGTRAGSVPRTPTSARGPGRRSAGSAAMASTPSASGRSRASSSSTRSRRPCPTWPGCTGP